MSRKCVKLILPLSPASQSEYPVTREPISVLVWLRLSYPPHQLHQQIQVCSVVEEELGVDTDFFIPDLLDTDLISRQDTLLIE